MKFQILVICVFLFLKLLLAQNSTNKVYVENGRLKYTDTNKEAAFFGVNYSTPFAHAYRSIKKLGLSHKQAIDMDVSHFARLEFDAYRIHVWDREVSDTLGNLLQNEHLELLDYLIFKLKEKNINIILTPIAWWGTGWPEPDPPASGFSGIYSKVELVTNQDACKAQKNYLKQFLNHKNTFSGVSYKDDSDIIAFEIINEPGHPSDTALVSDYINEMTDLIRNEGITKPVYYNISQNWSEQQAAAVYNARIDGISFQWYPTGLVKYAALKGNYLAHVDHYPVPEIAAKNFNNKTRMVYEFDAADVDQSVMYPAMARSFREAGMQWATMFSYDPTFLAANNTEYSTHYVNLLYTPQKAISLMIAANVFRTLKTYQKFSSYPENLEFAGFKISYENNLAEMNTAEKFYYSNSTASIPADLKKLSHIAGYGSSGLVKTNSKGAYFLDNLDGSAWRLELYPDVLERMNSYGKNSLDNKVRVLLSKSSQLTLSLPGLQPAFYIYPLIGESETEAARGGVINVKPGVYILSDKKIQSAEKLSFNYNKRDIDDYPVPVIEEVTPQLIHKAQLYINEGQPWQPTFTFISGVKADTAILYLKQPRWNNYRPVPVRKIDKYTFRAEIPATEINGIIEYCLYIRTADTEITYPSKVNKNPNAWDYFAKENWKVNVVRQENPRIIFNPATDQGNVNFPNVWWSVEFNSSVIWDNKFNPWFKVDLTKFKRPLSDFTFQIEMNNQNDSGHLNDYKYVEFEIDRQASNIESFTFLMVDSKYNTLEKYVNLSEMTGVIRVALDNFSSGEFVLLPRPYPHFLPYTFKAGKSVKNREETHLNFIQFRIAMDNMSENDAPKSLQFNSIKLVK
jgi:hypothetical protein